MATLEGLPAGVPITTEMVADHLARRRLGYGRGARMKFERDEVTFIGGVRHGLTLGTPVAVMVGNTEWPKWEQVMSADPVDPEILAGLARNAPLTRPRPGHADLAGMQKYGFDEARPILERASARETAARVALGAVARSYLKETAGIEIVSHVVELASAKAPYGVYPRPSDVEKLDADPVRCLDADASKAMVAEIDQAHKDGDTLGGVVEVLAYGVPVGLGSHVHWDRRLDARLAAALMGIQAIKGVEVGDGFDLARVPGSQAHDEILATDDGIRRATGRSGGTEGGLSTGELLRVRAAMKPIAGPVADRGPPRCQRPLPVRDGVAPDAARSGFSAAAAPPAGARTGNRLVAGRTSPGPHHPGPHQGSAPVPPPPPAGFTGAPAAPAPPTPQHAHTPAPDTTGHVPLPPGGPVPMPSAPPATAPHQYPGRHHPRGVAHRPRGRRQDQRRQDAGRTASTSSSWTWRPTTS
ncbi:Chorismate synthase [Streptomyces alboniger]